MKTFILRLESHDDIVSIRDKMGWAKDSRILIVWPEKGEFVQRRLDLLLIKRTAHNLGSQIAFITQDKEIRYHAPRLGIPVYKSIQKAQVQNWRLPKRYRKNLQLDAAVKQNPPFVRIKIASFQSPKILPRELSFPVRLIVFACGVFAVIALAAVLAPSARLSLEPRTLVQDVLINASTSPDVKSISLSGSVPSELVEVEIEGRDSKAVSGSIVLPDQASKGAALFTNLTDQSVMIPKKTVVRPAGITAQRYETIREAEVPSGPGEGVEVPIQSVESGEKSNLPAGELEVLEGLLGTQLSVTNPEPIVGGSNRIEPAPTDADRKVLASRLMKSLEKTALLEFERVLNPGDIVIPSSLKLVRTIDELYQPDAGLPADLLYLTERLRYEVRIIRAESLEKLAESVFAANMPDGFTPIQDSLQLEIIEEPGFSSSNTISWKIHAVRRIQAQINPALAIQLSLGLKPAEAINRLQSALPLDQVPQISVKPRWWPRMPFLPFRIDVIDSSDLSRNVGGSDQHREDNVRSANRIFLAADRLILTFRWFNHV